MSQLLITLLQVPLSWENKEENLQYLAQKIETLTSATDVIVLPELFSTGFSMQSQRLAETMQGKSVAWMRTVAAKKNCVLCGSLIVEEDGKYYNRFIWMQANGECSWYNKRHLFRMAGENEHYSSGENKVIVDYKGFKICLQVCYDLRFPVWSRRTARDNYDVLLYVANWPERRNHAWKSLLVARAIENQSYVIGVNRVGVDGNNIAYSGDSIALSYLGEALTQNTTAAEWIETVTLHKNELLNFRESFPAEKDADEFRILDLE
ncbi:MAG: amidohydrolase [Bacteroidetes bacterium]|nr:amidohydrolase [Bacteroidota bacterium]